MANVLIVDDERAVRRLLARWLSDAGYQVYEAETGEQSIAVARRSVIELVIMDVKLPDMTGFAAIDRIRALQGMAAIPVICLTGLDMRIDVAHDGGCTDLLLKPVEREAVMKMVGRFFRRTPGRS